MFKPNIPTVPPIFLLFPNSIWTYEVPKRLFILQVAYPFLQHKSKHYSIHVFNIFGSKWNLEFIKTNGRKNIKITFKILTPTPQPKNKRSKVAKSWNLTRERNILQPIMWQFIKPLTCIKSHDSLNYLNKSHDSLNNPYN